MIHLIADKLVEELKALSFVDKITGIVKPAKVNVGGVIKTFPIAYNVNPEVCAQSELMAYTPDSTKSTIIYFEDYGTRVTANENQAIYFESLMRLVCWINYKKLCGDLIQPSQIALSILNIIPKKLGNFDGLIGVWVTVEEQLPNDVNVFSKYSYQEEKNQYVTYPYDYVAFTLKATFYVRPNCIDEILKKVSVC